MLSTHKNAFQQTTTFGFPKDVVMLNNATTNEIYVQLQPTKGTMTQADIMTAVGELTGAGYTVATPSFISGFSIAIAAGSQAKFLTQTVTTSLGTETVAYILWQTPII